MCTGASRCATEAVDSSDEMDHKESQEDIDLEAYFNDYWESSSYSPQRLGTGEAPPLENTLTREPDLYDQLLWQIHMLGGR